MRPLTRADPHQGHGPRADKQAGYKWAMSNRTNISLANGSRTIQKGQTRAYGDFSPMTGPPQSSRSRPARQFGTVSPEGVI